MGKTSSIRNKFPKPIISSLASFPDDWPEIEYLAIPAYLGNNFNHFLDDPRDRANYGSITAAMVSPLREATVDVASNNTKRCAADRSTMVNAPGRPGYCNRGI